MDLLSRVRRLVGSEPALRCRPHLTDLLGEQTGLSVNEPASDAALFLNGRGLWVSIPELSESGGSWVGCVGDDRVACIYADADLAGRFGAEEILYEARLRGLLSGLPRRDVTDCVRLMDWPWDLVLANEAQLAKDWV